MSFTIQDILNLFPNPNFQGDATVRVCSVQIDSRKVGKDDLFVALRGENRDGHDFIQAALQQGAAACLVEKSSALPKTLLCDNSILALAKLATWYRKKITSPVIAITGSSGKTTTKELMHHVLSRIGKTQATTGNLNNHLGVPMTLLGFDPTFDFSIVEMGMNAPGEIANLAAMASPNIGLITSVGPAHIENFSGQITNIAKAKGELFAALANNSIAIVNQDEPLIVNLPTKVKRITFGFDSHADVSVTDVKTNQNGTDFVITYQKQKYPAQLQLFGRHHIQNALCVFATACALSVNLATVASAFQDFVNFKGRGQFLDFANGVIMDDTYNANPASMRAAFETLSTKFANHTKIAVLGDMFELGATAPEWHRQVGIAAKQYGINQLYVLGENSGHYLQGFGATAAEQKMQGFDTHAELAKKLFADIQSQKNVALLFKGSRGMRMENALSLFLEFWS